MGTIPSGFGQLPNGSKVRRWINLDNNALQGTLPDFSYFMHTPNLRMFSAANNTLTGVIPPSILSRYVWYIHLNNNRLTGSIPESSGPMIELEELWLHDNSLTGNFIPQNGGYLVRNQTYHDNYIHGEVDPRICESMRSSAWSLRTPLTLTADCLPSFLECSCCTKCYEGKRVTMSPSIVPSSRPTSI